MIDRVHKSPLGCVLAPFELLVVFLSLYINRDMFSRRCPLEKMLGRKLGKDKCQQCLSWRDGKCRYKENMEEMERKAMRGLPVLSKKAAIEAKKKGLYDEETAKEMERAALRLAKLGAGPQREYWEISRAYDEEWERASPEKRAELEWRMGQWQRFMEDGFSPKEANEKARQLNYDFWAGMKHEDENT